jgi:hypothetical protein
VLTLSPWPAIAYVTVRLFGMAVRLYADFATSSVQLPIARSPVCAVSAVAGTRIANIDPRASERESGGMALLL